MRTSFKTRAPGETSSIKPPLRQSNNSNITKKAPSPGTDGKRRSGDLGEGGGVEDVDGVAVSVGNDDSLVSGVVDDIAGAVAGGYGWGCGEGCAVEDDEVAGSHGVVAGEDSVSDWVVGDACCS